MSKGMVTSNSVGGPWQSGNDDTNNNSRRTVTKTKPKTKRSKK
tara:strand:+ start:9050 stop:9178 length:129 start_codon:yes stop_codon:yes gene_type:complete